MMTDEVVSRERRARRALARIGFYVRKSRSRDPRHVSYGGYRIVDDWNGVVGGGSYFALSLEDVETWAREPVVAHLMGITKGVT